MGAQDTAQKKVLDRMLRLIYLSWRIPDFLCRNMRKRKFWEKRGVKYLPRTHFSFHLVVCLTTFPKPLPKRALHIVRSRENTLVKFASFIWLRVTNMRNFFCNTLMLWAYKICKSAVILYLSTIPPEFDFLSLLFLSVV